MVKDLYHLKECHTKYESLRSSCKIKAASINPIDFKIRDGGLKMLLTYQFPLILGNDFAW